MASSSDQAAGGTQASVILNALGETVKSKWASSAGPSALSNFSTSLPDSVKTRASTLTSNYLSPRYFRPVSMCLGLGETKPYYVETSPGLAIDRFRRNVKFYYLNYIVLTAVLFACTLMVSPSSIIAIAILALSWFYVMKVTANDGILVGGVLITQKVATVAMSIVTVICLIWVLSSIFWYSLTVSGVCIFGHGAFRDATMVGDEDSMVEMDGDLEDVPFLNAKTGEEDEGMEVV